MKRAFLTVPTVVSLVLSLAAGGAGAPQAGNQRVPRHDAAAIIKLVAVRVLDASGRPVTGLRKEDFVVKDNGALQKVTEFESYVLGETGIELVSAGEAAPVRAPLLKRRLFIFLDLQGSDVVGLKNAKAAALHFVDTQLRPGDEVGVIGFSPMRGFFIQEYLTTEIDKIRKAIAKAKELGPSAGGMESFGPDDAGGGRRRGGTAGRGAFVMTEGGGDTVAGGNVNLGKTPGSLGGFFSASSTVFMPGTGVFQKGDFTPRMVDLAETLQYVPGNKSLVLFSGRDLGEAAKSLGQSFASSGTPIYAVNTRNWIIKGGITGIGGVKEKHIFEEHSLKDLAEASGGEYFADIEAVDKIAEEVQTLTGNFYVLGYYVPESWDGKFHKVDVEMAKPGYRVLAQAGYFNPKPFAEMEDFEKDLQLMDLLYADRPVAEVVEIPAIELGAGLAEGRRGVVLAEMLVDPKAGVMAAKVDLIAFVRNEDRVPVLSRKWTLNLQDYDGKTLLFSFGSPRQPGTYDGRVIIREVETGRAAVGRFAFEVPAPAAASPDKAPGQAPAEEGIVLSSPVLIVPGEGARLVRLQRTPPRKGQAPEPNLVDLYPFIPRDHRIVVGELASGIGQVTALLPVRMAARLGGEAPRVAITARLLPRVGEGEIPLDLEVVEAKTAKDGREFLVLRISLEGVGPGAYELEIAAEDTSSEKRGTVRTPLVLK